MSTGGTRQSQQLVRRTQALLLAVVASFFGEMPVVAEQPAKNAESSNAADVVQTADSKTKPNVIGLDTLESWAIDNNPTLQLTLAEVERLRGIHTQVGLRPNPVVGYQAAEVGNERHAGQQGAFVSQNFITAGKLGLNRQVVQQQIEAATWNWQAQGYRVRTAVRRQYYQLLAANKTLTTLKEIASFAQQAEEKSQHRLDAGEGNRSQLLQAQVEVRRTRLAQIAAENDRQEALRKLAAVVGVESFESFNIIGDLEWAVPELEWNETLAWLLSESPEIHAVRFEIQQARWGIQRAKVEPIPNVQTQAVLQYDTSTNYTVAGLQVGLPLPFNNRNQGNIRAAHAELIRSSNEIRRKEFELRDRLAGVFRQYQSSRAQAHDIRDDILPLANENVQLSLERFGQGEASYLELLTAQRTYFETQLVYIDILKQLRLAVVTMQGFLLDDGLNAPAAAHDGTSSSNTPQATHLPFIQP